MRSLLFVPADDQRKIEKAPHAGADALILDLEDSVHPQAKSPARSNLLSSINHWRNVGVRLVFVRVNAMNTHLFEEDLGAAVAAGANGVILPKSEGGASVSKASALLNAFEARNGVNTGQTKIIALATETALGTLSLASYHPANPRLTALTWGAEDLATEVGAQRNRRADGTYTDVFRIARGLTLLAATAAQVTAIDTVFTEFANDQGLIDECENAVADGFKAKLAIHPRQVPIINRAFTPNEETIERARSIVAAFAENPNLGVVAIDGRMYDIPHLKQAQSLLADLKSKMD